MYHHPPPHISMVVSQKVGVSSLARPNRSLHLRREPSPYQNSLFERQNSPFFAILSPVAETSIAQPHQHPFLPPPAPISHRNFSHRPLRRSPDCWEGREWGGVEKSLNNHETVFISAGVPTFNGNFTTSLDPTQEQVASGLPALPRVLPASGGWDGW